MLKFIRRAALQICLVLVIVGALSYGMVVIVRTIPNGQDERLSTTASDVANNLNAYIADHHTIPVSLASVYQEPIPSGMTYKRLSLTAYKFCLTFRTQSPDFDPASSEDQQNSMSLTALYVSYVHGSGQQCQIITPFISPYLQQNELVSHLCGIPTEMSWAMVQVEALTLPTGNTSATLKLASYPPATYTLDAAVKVYSDSVNCKEIPLSDVHAGDMIDLYFAEKGGPVIAISEERFGGPYTMH